MSASTNTRQSLKHKFPGLYNSYLNARLFWKFKSFNPQKVKLYNSDHSIYVNWKEPRGRAMLLGGGKGQPKVKNFWRACLDKLSPDLVLDCGANYGEMLFLPTYQKHMKVVAIEADPHLDGYLRKSWADHSNKSQIEIHNALASNESNAYSKFYVKKIWSGASSAIKNPDLDPKNVEEITVPTITVDSLFSPAETKNKGLVFKIDVEGFEPFVLKGMKDLLASVDNCIGCIEFNTLFFERLNSPVEDFLKYLSDHFKIAIWVGPKKMKHIHPLTMEQLTKEFGSSDIETDFVLVSDLDLIRKIGYELV